MTTNLLRMLLVLAAILSISAHAATVEVSSANNGATYSVVSATDFVLTPGTYAISINGFDTYGGVSSLTFPYGNTASVINYAGADGELVLQWAFSTNLISVTLTGIGSTTDAQIFSEASFKTAFNNAGVIAYASPVNGACGSANGGSLSTVPSSNLCSAGTAGTISGSGPWSWSCVGAGGGTTASCSASLYVEDSSPPPAPTPTTPPTTTPTDPTPVVIPGTDPGTTQTVVVTPVSSAGTVFTNPQSNTTVDTSTGVVVVTGTLTTPLNVSSSAPIGSAIQLATTNAVPIVTNNTTLIYQPLTVNTLLQVQSIPTGTGTTTTGLQVAAGTSNITAPAQGSTIPIVVASENTVVAQTQANDTQVTAGRRDDQTIALSVNSGTVTYQATSQATGTVSMTLYSGETVNVQQSSGDLQNIRLGSFNQDQGLPGDFIPAPPQAGSAGLHIPIIAGDTQRFGDDLGTRFGQALIEQFGVSPATGGTPFVAQNTVNGVTTVATSSGLFRLLPVGDIVIAGNQPRAVSTGDIAANLVAVIGASLSFAISPATAYDDLGNVLKQIDAAATLEVLGDGVVLARVAGMDFVAIPDFLITPGGQPAPVLENVDNQLTLQDKDGNRQKLYPAFADTEKLRTTFSFLFPQMVLNYAGTGEYRVTLQPDTQALTLLPEILLTSPASSHAEQSWWMEGEKIFIRYSSGNAQGFEVR